MTNAEFLSKHPYCMVCGTMATDRHHIKTRGAGGDDSEENGISLCRIHHIHVHSMGWRRFAKEHGLEDAFEAVMKKEVDSGW